MTRNMLKLLGLGITLLGIGLEVTSVTHPEFFNLLPELIAKGIGPGVGIIGLIILTLAFLTPVYVLTVKLSQSITPKLKERYEYEFDFGYCSSTEIQEVFQLGNGILGKLTKVSEVLLTQRHRTNDKIIRYTRKKRSNGTPMTGYYIIYPIKRECEKLINKGLLKRGEQIELDHICKDFSRAAALYISMVFGEDRNTRGYILDRIENDLAHILTHNRRIKSVYVRPCSPDGYRLVKKFKFRQMSGSDIWYLETKELEWINKKLRAGG
jgi:hypothetical protein